LRDRGRKNYDATHKEKQKRDISSIKEKTQKKRKATITQSVSGGEEGLRGAGGKIRDVGSKKKCRGNGGGQKRWGKTVSIGREN